MSAIDWTGMKKINLINPFFTQNKSSSFRKRDSWLNYKSIEWSPESVESISLFVLLFTHSKVTQPISLGFMIDFSPPHKLIQFFTLSFILILGIIL